MISIEENDQLEIPSTLPLLTVRDLVVFPFVIVGRLLPVGGLPEKLLVALRAGLTEVVVPAQNREDIDLVPPEVLKQLVIVQGAEINEVLGKVLVRTPFGAVSKSHEGAQRGKHDSPGPEMTPVAGV